MGRLVHLRKRVKRLEEMMTLSHKKKVMIGYWCKDGSRIFREKVSRMRRIWISLLLKSMAIMF